MKVKKWENVSYLEMGFNDFGLNRITDQKPLSANDADYLLELAEYSVSNKKVKSVSADKLTAGTLSAVTNVGDESIKIDGENRRILVNDGTNDRVLIGYGSSLF